MTVVDTSWNLYIFSHPPKFKHKITHWNSKRIIFECYLLCFFKIHHRMQWDMMIWGRLFNCPFPFFALKRKMFCSQSKPFLAGERGSLEVHHRSENVLMFEHFVPKTKFALCILQVCQFNLLIVPRIRSPRILQFSFQDQISFVPFIKC